MNEKKEKGNDRDQGSDELKNGQKMVTPTRTTTTDEQRREQKRQENMISRKTKELIEEYQ